MRNAALICIVTLSLVIGARSQTTEFTYQGRLTVSGAAATTPHDFEFRLFTAPTGGTQLGTTLSRSNVTVSNGVFTVPLDFGEQFDGADRWLRIDVRPAGGTTFEMLTPRQRITSAPYSMQSRSANAADSLSINCVLCVTDGQILSIDGSKVIGSVANAATASTAGNVTGIVAIANGGTGSSTQTFVDLSSTQSAIGGDKTFTGTLSGSIVNATTQYDIGSNRILSNNGTDNLFAGVGAGGANASGERNSFFGAGAGQLNTSGSFNAFFGSDAGFNNSTGDLNAFFGRGAGRANTAGGENAFFGTNAGANTTGNSNSFFGRSSGQGNLGGSDNAFFGMFAGNANRTGNNNTVIGTFADLGADNLSFATAIGAGSVVSSSNTIALGRSSGQDTVVVPGTLAANGSGLTNLNANNITSGTLAIANGGTGSSTKNFVDLSTNQIVGGNKHFTGQTAIGTMPLNSFLSVAAPPGFIAVGGTAEGIGGDFLGGQVGLRGTASFVTGSGPRYGVYGEASGTAETLHAVYGQAQSFSGSIAGFGVFGRAFGSAITNYGVYGIASGGTTNWAGYFAGNTHVTGALYVAGARMVAANGPYIPGSIGPNTASNTFVGDGAGLNVAPDPNPSSPVGKANTFLGASAGYANTTAGFNTYIGRFAGFNATSSDENVFVGAHTGFSGNSTGGGVNTSIGAFSSVTANLSYQTAIGARASVTQSNSLVLGAIAGVNASPVSVNVGIGTTAPAFKLHVIDGSNTGVRIQTNTAGGTVASFGGNGAFNIDASGSPGGRMMVLENGNVGIGTVPDQRLTVNGNASKLGGGSWATFSDERLKNVGGRFTRGIADLMRLNPIRFEYKPHNALGLRGAGEYIGFIAQEVQRVVPEAVRRGEHGYLQVNNDPILWTTLNAVKEQQGQIEAQAAEIKSQEKQIADLQGQIELLKKQVELLRALVCADRPGAEICKEERK